MVEPNGKQTFFNIHTSDNQEFDITMAIDTCLEYYFKSIPFMSETKYRHNYLCETVKYTSASNMNVMENGVYTIGNGHCVIITIMVLHLLHLDPTTTLTKVFEDFSRLEDDERAFLIGNYSSSIYKLLVENALN